MKRTVLVVLLLSGTLNLVAQREDEDTHNPGLPPNRVYVGSGVGLGFTSGSFNIGLNPEIGYTAAQWIDLGMAFNLNYYSLSGDYNYGVHQTSFNYGGGPVIRIYPVRFLFVQGQYEYNRVDYTLKDQVNGGSTKYTVTSSSILAGIGYAQRIVGQVNFYTVLLLDLNNDANSPYTDSYGSPYPFLRAGFNFYLGSNRKK